MAGAFDSMETRILSHPFPVEWAGWETTTRRLYGCGWKIATQFNYGESNYRFLFKHDEIDLMGYADWMYIDRAAALPYNNDRELPCIRVGHVARQMYTMRPFIVDEHVRDITDWQLIDGRTQMSREPVRKMEDFSVFAKLHSKEILIPQADMSVVEQLEAIIKAQEPRQHELRQIILAKPRGIRQIASIAEVA